MSTTTRVVIDIPIYADAKMAARYVYAVAERVHIGEAYGFVSIDEDKPEAKWRIDDTKVEARTK